MSKNIAIDGPAGAGKSTIAKLLAKKMGFNYVDTGAMYRGLAVQVLDAGVEPGDETAVSAAVISSAVPKVSYIDGEQHIFINDTDVTNRLRTEEIGNAASKISAYPAVRAALLDLQRDLAQEYDVIMDGRDIGTTILPGADLKIFLTASVEVRAGRRYDELSKKGEAADLKKIAEDIAARDHQDMTRAISPLKQAEDAILVDTSDMSIDQVVEHIYSLYEEKF
ncbi:MAG: (d)CMP kinase [Lachnospiraceae bacterium]|nr:(d)CMP kinase [Lachnospiraceae bacterium]